MVTSMRTQRGEKRTVSFFTNIAVTFSEQSCQISRLACCVPTRKYLYPIPYQADRSYVYSFNYWLIFSDTFTCLHISVHTLDESKQYPYITLLLSPKRYLFTLLLIPIVPPQQHSLAIPIVPRCYCRVQEKFRHFSKNKGHSARCSGKKKLHT